MDNPRLLFGRSAILKRTICTIVPEGRYQGQFKFTRCLDFVTLGSKEGKCSVSIPADTLRRFFNALHSVQ
ncbi:MAG: hypothetical protein ACRDTG_17230, partial [Pseudonocardiaceae bacterium]